MRFRTAAATAGSDTVGAWLIVKLFQGTDGLDDAQLRNESDPSRRKTVARSSLLNRKLYARVPA